MERRVQAAVARVLGPGRPQWRAVEESTVKVLTGGLSNQLFTVTLPSTHPPPHTVVAR